MPRKLNIRELLKDTEYDHLAEMLAIKIESWGLDNDRDIYSLSTHGKIAGFNPNLIVERIIGQSQRDHEAHSTGSGQAPKREVVAFERFSEIKASSAAVEIAVENEIDLSVVDGSGKDGTIVKKDVEKFINEEDKHDD